LYVKQGNPDLKQEFSQMLRLTAQLVNPFKGRNAFAFFTFQHTQNKIVNYDRINSFGVDSVMPVNVNGVYNMNGSLSWGLPVKFLKGSIQLASNLSLFKNKQLLNSAQHTAEENSINTMTLGPRVRLSTTPNDKLDISIEGSVSYSNTKYSIQSARNTNYFSQDYSADFNWEMPKRFFFSTDFNYRINNQYADGFNVKVPLWNASISRQMLRYNRGELKLAVNDILNKNTGVNRSTSQNYIEDSRVNTLKRFFLLSFTYSLSKTGLNNAGNGGGGIRVISR